MTATHGRVRRPPVPLNATRLDELALAYVARFATSRARLVAYLRRKLKERGWADDVAPDPDAIAARMAGLGYIDDALYARAKARSLGSRGYGARRVAEGLRAAGIEEGDREAALALAAEEAIASILRFARRRRLGPFGAGPAGDPGPREKAIAAMVRAGHDLRLARLLVDLPGEDGGDEEMLAQQLRSRL